MKNKCIIILKRYKGKHNRLLETQFYEAKTNFTKKISLQNKIS